MNKRIEHKFIDLKALKMTDSGPGTVEGYRSVFNVIDESGDIVIPGAFDDSQDEYMSAGFTAENHLWTFKDVVGYPVEAHSDGYGWFVKSEFHTTQAAQDVRTVAKERMAAGKTVGFSFGYQAKDYEFIQAADFKTKLPQFIRADALSKNLTKAEGFSQIRILKKVNVIEDSIVTTPMNKLASATSVKSVRGRSSVNDLRVASLRLQSQAMRTLYGSTVSHIPQISGDQLRMKSLRLRAAALRTLAERWL